MAAYSRSYGARPAPAQRATSAALAALLVALLILVLLRMGGVRRDMFGDGRPLTTFDVATEQGERPSAAREERQRPREQASRAKPVPRPDRATPDRPPQPVPDPIVHLPGVMMLSRADYAATDLSRIKGTAPPRGSGQGLAAAGEGDSQPVGLGPGGAQLYPAEWYREPRAAETQPFMPRGKTGWGMVACRTIDRYHVEDCRELGETPGSGIARGLRQAAFQFLVRPPRVGGKPQIGTWVRIRFDLRPALGSERVGDEPLVRERTGSGPPANGAAGPPDDGG